MRGVVKHGRVRGRTLNVVEWMAEKLDWPNTVECTIRLFLGKPTLNITREK
jgi:hypothetical protein